MPSPWVRRAMNDELPAKVFVGDHDIPREEWDRELDELRERVERERECTCLGGSYGVPHVSGKPGCYVNREDDPTVQHEGTYR